MKKASLYVGGVLRAEVIAADTFFLRARGLIGRKIMDVVGLLLQPCSQIHTFFMSGPIDVIYLDRDNYVLHLDKAVSPWKCCRPYSHAYSVLELAAGKAEEFGITVGSNLSFR